MQHVLVLIGVSGSGKSTFAYQFLHQNPSYLRLNRDDLRRTLSGVSLREYWQWEEARKNRLERVVTAMERAALRSALTGGWNVVLDNTHLRRQYLEEITTLVGRTATNERPVDISFRVIDVPLETAIERDRLRPEGIGEAGIRQQWERLTYLRHQMDLNERVRFPVAQAE